MASRFELASDSGKAKLAIVMEVVAPYRIPVFNRLAEHLGNNLLVLFMSARGGREWEIPFSQMRFPYKVMRGLEFVGRSPNPFPRYWNREVITLLRRFAPTLTVIVGYHHPTSYAVWWYAKLWGSKLYLLCESNMFDHRSRRMWVEGIKKIFIRTCDGHIVPGRASRAYLKSYGVDEKKIFLTPNSIDTDTFVGRTPSDGDHFRSERQRFQEEWDLPAFNLLFVGRLASEKGVPIAIEVVKRLQDMGVEAGLIVVGDGVLRGELEAMVQREGVRHTIFLGFKRPGELAFYYRMADLLIHPAESEPWGLVVNEAMTYGVPVLCSPHVGAGQDLVIEDQTGYICNSPVEYVQKIHHLLNNPAHLLAMRECCRQLAASFSPEACAEGFLNAFRSVSNSR